MSNYNTTKDNKIKTVILNKTDYPCSRTLKNNTTIFSESVIAQVFYSLQRADQKGIQTDHSLSIESIRTLNIEQVQSLIHIHCKITRSREDITDALQSLKQPKAIDVAETTLTSEIYGDEIEGVRLHYTEMPVNVEDLTSINSMEDLKSELSKVDIAKKEKVEDWKAKAFELQEQREIDRAAIQSLRAIIVDMSETLHEADPSARISMTSADLLELMQGREDTTNNPF